MWNTSDTSDRAHTPWKLDVSLRLRSTRGHFVLTVAFSLSLSPFFFFIFLVSPSFQGITATGWLSLRIFDDVTIILEILLAQLDGRILILDFGSFRLFSLEIDITFIVRKNNYPC